MIGLAQINCERPVRPAIAVGSMTRRTDLTSAGNRSSRRGGRIGVVERHNAALSPSRPANRFLAVFSERFRTDQISFGQ
jgi:hypothetical protein